MGRDENLGREGDTKSARNTDRVVRICQGRRLT